MGQQKTNMVNRESRDFYKILGINKTATQDEIRKAYRKLALENHPDRNPDKTGAEAKIKEINAAYECLSDEKKKQEYDLNGNFQILQIEIRSPICSTCFSPNHREAASGEPVAEDDHVQWISMKIFLIRDYMQITQALKIHSQKQADVENGNG